MVPMQGMALVGHCPVDSHLTPGHTVYAPKGEYTANGKHHIHRLPALHQVHIQHVQQSERLITLKQAGLERKLNSH